MSINKNPIRWDLDLSPIVGVPVRIETTDGGIRSTEISRITFDEVELAGVMCPIPKRLELDSPFDWIDIQFIKSVEVL